MIEIVQKCQISSGDQFVATDRYGRTCRYKYIGNLSFMGTCCIDLLNKDTAEHVFVEPEWFAQRVIHKL